MASAAKAGGNTELNTIDGYIAPSQSGNIATTEDEASQVVPGGGNTAPVDESDSEPPPMIVVYDEEDKEPPAQLKSKHAMKHGIRRRKKTASNVRSQRHHSTTNGLIFRRAQVATFVDTASLREPLADPKFMESRTISQLPISMRNQWPCITKS